VVEQLKFVLPAQGAGTIVRTAGALRRNSSSLGIVGAVGLLYSTTNFFSCIESALNIIYGVNNRHFLRQKRLVLVLMFLATVFFGIALTVVVVALPLLRRADRFAGTALHLNVTDYGISIVVSFVLAFLFFLGCYRFLPNVQGMRTSHCWRGAAMATVLFEASVHLLPAWISAQRGSVVLTAFAGALILLVWFYLMAFILLAGGVFNWWWVARRGGYPHEWADYASASLASAESGPPPA
jgi:YihY family inner membrane protein